jgi:hypothetical protein
MGLKRFDNFGLTENRLLRRAKHLYIGKIGWRAWR